MLHASELVVYDGQQEVARHERLIAKGRAGLDLDHYLEALVRKHGAFPGATALEQARSAGKFTPVHDAWWAAAKAAHGEREATRALIEALLMGRHVPHEHLVAGPASAVRAGALTADAVALEPGRRRSDRRRRRPGGPEGGRSRRGRGSCCPRGAGTDERDLPDRTAAGAAAARHPAAAFGRGLRPAAESQAGGRPPR
ncbi:DUF5395 domain-containing protein [Streptomyces capitiformicae]|uniref:DUF5395 domain-containing protein n=1 Tax=Streptomyces capitiformicae TaxID=2014920 RepID=UPI001E589C41|nr:DUF5395 domain-containing protein [Streptomyces capitiformicae]